MTKALPPDRVYRVKLSRQDLTFSAGHVSTYEGELEGHHGHNYQLSLEFEGQLDGDALLVDFRVVKKVVRGILSRLNHRTLVPALHPGLEIERKGDSTIIRFGEERLELPARHVVLLELPNLTSEMLAFHIYESLVDGLPGEATRRLDRITVEIAESPGQSAAYSARVE